VKAALLGFVLALTRVPPLAGPVPAAQAPGVAPDRDKDRIPDARDQCPDQPETYNGVDDADGCPDKGPVVTHICKVEILDHILFAANSAALAPPAVALLEDLAATLRGNPQIRGLEVRGHQVAGERAGLGRARARVVAAALVSHGVKTELIIKDRGRSEPTCARAGESCSTQSRRVEFAIVRIDDPRK